MTRPRQLRGPCYYYRSDGHREFKQGTTPRLWWRRGRIGCSLFANTFGCSPAWTGSSTRVELGLKHGFAVLAVAATSGMCPSLILMNSGMPYCLDGAARHRWFPFVRPRSRFCPLRVPGWFHKTSGMPRRYGHSDCTCGNWKSRFGGEVVRLRGRIVYLSASKLDKLLQSAGKFPLGSSFSRGRHEIS